MNPTHIYLIRHAESDYEAGNERDRGLTEKGRADAQLINQRLASESVDAVYSSPYERAQQTILTLSEALRKDIIVEENLRERKMAGTDFIIGNRFQEAKKMLYFDFSYSYLGGESGEAAQRRAIPILMSILDRHVGKNVAIGTHGDIMTLMMNHFDKRYGYAFWAQLTMPDIYKLTFEERNPVQVERLWESP